LKDSYYSGGKEKLKRCNHEISVQFIEFQSSLWSGNPIQGALIQSMEFNPLISSSWGPIKAIRWGKKKETRFNRLSFVFG